MSDNQKPLARGRGVSLRADKWEQVDARIRGLDPWVKNLSDYISRLIEADLRFGILDDGGAPAGLGKSMLAAVS